MVSEIQIFNNEEFGKLKSIEKSTPLYFGYVYVLEYGNQVKIGQTKNPYQRITALNRQGKKYSDKDVGRVAIMPRCTNYREIEKNLHKIFEDYRKPDTELFSLSFEDTLSTIRQSNLDYQDNSKELEKQGDQLLDFMKGFMRGNIKCSI